MFGRLRGMPSGALGPPHDHLFAKYVHGNPSARPSYNPANMHQATRAQIGADGDQIGPPAAPAESPPDWSTLDRELHCPRCDYNLHMLTSPRCPECGLEFAWSALLSVPEYRQDCPIFEYRWRKRPARSFFYTLWLVLRPWRCWRTIRVEDDPRLLPIAAQVILLLTAQSLALMAAFLLWIYSFGLTRPSAYSLVEEARRYLISFASLTAYSPMFLRLAAPLLLILASLFVYQLTYSRWRVRWQHVVRLAVYSWMTWLLTGRCEYRLKTS